MAAPTSRVYVETTIISYLAGRPSRDLIVCANQEVTRQWWDVARKRDELLVSDTVLAEIRLGDPDAAARRLAFTRGLEALPLTDVVADLAELYEKELKLPQRLVDATHIAFAVHHQLDYLVTWNCSHIASGPVMRRLMETNRRLGRVTPLICTPMELLGESPGVEP